MPAEYHSKGAAPEERKGGRRTSSSPPGPGLPSLSPYQFPFELRHLLYFREVARRLHFRQAAASLAVPRATTTRGKTPVISS